MTTEESERVTAYIAERLRVMAFSQRVSQGEIGKRAGLSRSAVNEYLNGKAPIPLSAFIDICAAIGAKADEVLADAQRDA